MTAITVKATINQEIEKVWQLWTTPADITQWNFATPEWQCPRTEHDFREGGKFKYHMAAKDGSFAFDYEGKFVKIKSQSLLHTELADGRKVSVEFTVIDNKTQVVETFEAEEENSIELQRQGWQAILDNFKKYAESK